MLSAELLLVLVVALSVCGALSAFEEWRTELLALQALTTIAGGIDDRRGHLSALPPPHRLYPRKNASDGYALGSCMPALLLGALAAARARAQLAVGPLRAHLWSAIGCAIQPSIALILGGSPLFCGIAGHVVGLAASCVGPDVLNGHVPYSLALSAVAAAVHCAAYRWALTRVRGSFTLGEASALSQAAALLVSDATLLTSCRAMGVGAGGAAAARGDRAASVWPPWRRGGGVGGGGVGGGGGSTLELDPEITGSASSVLPWRSRRWPSSPEASR